VSDNELAVRIQGYVDDAMRRAVHAAYSPGWWNGIRDRAVAGILAEITTEAEAAATR
jgi:hypothetical protein